MCDCAVTVFQASIGSLKPLFRFSSCDPVFQGVGGHIQDSVLGD
jgi:hypothetical protein